jgi:protocatechuate 3,4-dioxygenase beta subunit
VATYDHNVTTHEWATGYTWDIVLSGSHRTAVVHDDPELARTLAASVQQRLAA